MIFTNLLRRKKTDPAMIELEKEHKAVEREKDMRRLQLHILEDRIAMQRDIAQAAIYREQLKNMMAEEETDGN